MKAAQTLKFACLLCVVILPTATSGAQTVTKIAAGASRSLILKSGGSLWTVGFMGPASDESMNTETNRHPQPPQFVSSNVTAMAAGQLHTLFLKSDGSLWAMGDSCYGQLGDGSYDSNNVPKMIVASNVVAIAAGNQHSLFLKSNGSLWAMGYNNDGQLGDGSSGAYARTNLPEQIVSSNVTAIAAGGVHSLFLKSDGSLWAMGYNYCGQLGNGTYGGYDQTGSSYPEQIVSSNVTAIAAGDLFSLFLKSDGSLWAMGSNETGQLGAGAYKKVVWPTQIVSNNVAAIAAGSSHSLFLKSDGSLWAMGLDYSGELGDGINHGATNQPEQVVSSSVTAIAAGGDHSLFLKSDGSLWAMGHNFYGQLGDGTTNDTNRPERILTDPAMNKFWLIRSTP